VCDDGLRDQLEAVEQAVAERSVKEETELFETIR
jgi:hypothetical protein